MRKVPFNIATELKVNNICGFYIREVKSFGTSAKVDCPKEHLGKTVYLVILTQTLRHIREWTTNSFNETAFILFIP
jgi:putative transposon-encoded protein